MQIQNLISLLAVIHWLYKVRGATVQGKELQRARRWVTLGTKRKEGALQIQTVGEYKYIYKYKDKQRTQSGGPLKREDFERKIPIEDV